MVIYRSQNKITDFLMILAWASPFNGRSQRPDNDLRVDVAYYRACRPTHVCSTGTVVIRYSTIDGVQ